MNSNPKLMLVPKLSSTDQRASYLTSLRKAYDAGSLDLALPTGPVPDTLLAAIFPHLYEPGRPAA